RLVIKGKSRAGLSQRLGRAPALGPPPPAGRVWLHAVSAGEVVAAAPIARWLGELSPETEVVISTTTPAGQQQARRLIPTARAHFYFPFDYLPCVARALGRVRPTVIAAVETEIWPNWLFCARRRGIPALVLNGKISDRGFRRARRFAGLYRWALGLPEALLMQSEQDAERALALGARRERVRVAGQTKFEQTVSRLDTNQQAALRAEMGLDAARPLLVAGSTHPGEEEQVLAAWEAARAAVPGLQLLIAPRHIERAPALESWLRGRGYEVARRSQPWQTLVQPSGAIWLLDTMGELARTYALADVVFVGGSLVPVGGHDLLQPLFHGKPVLCGPHVHNQRDSAALILAEGAGAQVADVATLAQAVVNWLASPAQAEAVRAAGQRLLARHRGAARACAEALLQRVAKGSLR
ncbi:MAG: 3-deoxy-D-manno-octulosonic acid transferase, partial [Armatimonadetes bacterium]|nr:3-deoxy-D-manno-octulosonic acid transferase [Armatimonadota bacterium]